MNYEKAYKELKIEILGTVGGYRNFLENNLDVEFTHTYQDAIAQVEILEKLETFIYRQDED